MASDESRASHLVTVITQGIIKTLECLEPWLDDGSVVLVVQEKCFRVHRTVLGAYSEIFKDMFTLPQPGDTEEDIVDGCPVVYFQDTVEDVQIMLRALYDRSFVFFYNTPMPILVLRAFLRMGKKYAMSQLFQEAKRRLSLASPPLVCASEMSAAGNITLFPRISGNDPFNFVVMNIANEVGLLSTVLMATFYCCLTCPPQFIADGYEFNGERVTLSASSQRYCILVQHYIADVEREMVQTLAQSPFRCSQRTTGHTCSYAMLSNLRSFQKLKSPFSLWVPAWDNGTCSTCREDLRKRHADLRTKLWKNFPIALGLGPWEDLDEDSGLGIPNPT